MVLDESMNFDAIVSRMELLPGMLSALTVGLSPADARWKPEPRHWSILEVCCHLLDEELEDFRVRVASTLSDPSKPWPPLELENVAERRGYNTRDLHVVVSEFARERANSVHWLRNLRRHVASMSGGDGRIDWDASYQHPKFGPIRAGEVMAAWAAHDALHLRQISKRLHEMAARDGGGYGVRYAGEW